MKHFLLTLTIDGRAQPEGPPAPDWLTEMIRYSRALRESGVLLGADGLGGARLRFTNGRVVALQNRFANPAAALWLIRAESASEALRWASRAPVWNGEVEVREVLDFEAEQAVPADVLELDRRPGEAGELPQLTAGRPAGGW